MEKWGKTLRCQNLNHIQPFSPYTTIHGKVVEINKAAKNVWDLWYVVLSNSYFLLLLLFPSSHIPQKLHQQKTPTTFYIFLFMLQLIPQSRYNIYMYFLWIWTQCCRGLSCIVFIYDGYLIIIYIFPIFWKQL